MDKIKQLLDYIASQEEAILTYRASDMILAVHSDTGYINEPEATVELEATSTFHPTKKSPQTMELYSTLPK